MNGLLLQIPVLGLGLEEFLLLVITAAAGGAFGAAVGALPAFIFTGFMVFLGEGLAILSREVVALDGVGATTLTAGITGTIGFGPITGPHVAFAGGVAASAYAGKKYPEMEPEGWDYHFGKNILYAFGTKPDILAVGAVFGVIGLLIAQVLGAVGFPTDPVGLSIVVTAFLGRAVFGYPLVGKPSGSSILDMSPFEREEPRMSADGGEPSEAKRASSEPRSDGGTVPEEHAGRLATEPWLPHQYEWGGVTAIGIAGSILGAFVYIQTGSIFLIYGLSAISLLFLNLGVEKMPVTHHITTLGAVGAAVATPMVGSSVVVLLAGMLVGTLSALVGELTQRIFYSHSGTHIDPPAMAFTVMMFIIGILHLAGILPNAGFLGI
ncbi:hypothetical protein EGH22_10305 [Halomicroarcula sp. F28]|uniref:hypothetical protein n=1 Tax=Haloarcula salinisoli TaxID=2487746 RepID=UPI001C73DB3F|nr:hypothetical protein [Halomicroarcula salinisoli]MBX0286720.1 hypothetical protein [Halomicroarcula salinisoli]